MKLPKQSAPIQRNIAGAAISSNNGSVEASDWKDVLGDVAANVAGALIPMVPGWIRGK